MLLAGSRDHPPRARNGRRLHYPAITLPRCQAIWASPEERGKLRPLFRSKRTPRNDHRFFVFIARCCQFGKGLPRICFELILVKLIAPGLPTILPLAREHLDTAIGKLRICVLDEAPEIIRLARVRTLYLAID